MKQKQITGGPTFLAILTIVLLILAWIAGFFMGKSYTMQGALSSGADTGERRLLISAVADREAGSTVFSPEELNGAVDNYLHYVNLTDVTVELDGVPVPLEQALREGAITVEEITAYARIDAKNGICQEKYESTHGLTEFTYRYPEFNLQLIYDVYETPDGKQHLIQSINLYRTGSGVSNAYYDFESEYTYRLDREDWGLTFEVVQATPTSITLNCTQSGGQQFGELEIMFYTLFAEGFQFIPTLDSVESIDDYGAQITIEQNADSQLTINWACAYEPLSSGDYYIELHIQDIFDASQVHPLADDFYDMQEYYIPFSIS